MMSVLVLLVLGEEVALGREGEEEGTGKGKGGRWIMIPPVVCKGVSARVIYFLRVQEEDTTLAVNHWDSPAIFPPCVAVKPHPASLVQSRM